MYIIEYVEVNNRKVVEKLIELYISVHFQQLSKFYNYDVPII